MESLEILYLLAGITIGIFSTLSILIILFVRWLLQLLYATPKSTTVSSPFAATPTSKLSSHDLDTPKKSASGVEWPESSIRYLEQALSSTQPTLDPHHFWLNLLIHRYFLECRKSEVLKTKLKNKVAENLGKRFRAESGSGLVVGDWFMRDVEIMLESR